MPSMKKIVKPRRSSSLRILHVDDDTNQLFFTKLFLERCNPDLSVESLLKPSAVTTVLQEKKYDCIVSDYQMDEMDGVDLTRKIRLVSDVPIIIYTGRGSEEIESIARAAGADGYVQKQTDPTHYRGLNAQICDVINDKMTGIIKPK